MARVAVPVDSAVELDPLGRTFMISFRKQFLPKSYLPAASCRISSNAFTATASAIGRSFPSARIIVL